MKILDLNRFLETVRRVLPGTGRTTGSKARLRIGMSLDELITLLGEPTGVRRGADLWGGEGTVVVVGSHDAPSDALPLLQKTDYMCRRRPEADYYLNIVDGKLDEIHRIVEKAALTHAPAWSTSPHSAAVTAARILAMRLIVALLLQQRRPPSWGNSRPCCVRALCPTLPTSTGKREPSPSSARYSPI